MNLSAKISNLLLIINLSVCLHFSALTQHFCMILWNVTKNWNIVITQEQNLSALFVIMWVLQNMIWMYIHTLTTKLNHTCEYYNDQLIYEHKFVMLCAYKTETTYTSIVSSYIVLWDTTMHNQWLKYLILHLSNLNKSQPRPQNMLKIVLLHVSYWVFY